MATTVSQPGYYNLQAFTSLGALMAGGKLFTYSAGTTAHKVAYTEQTGTTPHTYSTDDGGVTQYIALDSRGELPYPLYLTPGAYDIALKTPAGATVWTRRADPTGANLEASSGSSLVGFLQAGTGAVSRTVQDKERDVVSIKDFGAVGDGSANDTSAIQLALNSGATSVYIPSGTFNFTTLTIPNVFGFVLYGDGPASMLKQTGTGIKWATAGIVYNEQTLRDFGITGTDGTDDSIQTAGAGGLTLQNLYFTDTPTAKSSIYVNGAAATYVHDTRLIGIQIYYSSTAGYAGIRLGALSSDQSITQFIMNGGLATNYCIHADAGALTLTMSDSHPYNASINVMKFAGAGTSCGFSNVVFDRALADTVDITSMTTSVFTGCYFQASVNGFSNVKLTTCDGVDFVSCHWDGAAGSVSCVETDAGSSNISVQNGAVASIGNYTTPFDLLGTYSYARGIAGFNPFGMAFSPAFCSAAAQAQNTTNYLGPNGINTTEINSVYVVPQDVKILSAYCIADTTPAVGQTFTFTVRVDGADVGTPLVVNNGSFGGVITCAVDASQYQRICIKSVFSATSGAASIRGLINFSA